MRVGARRGKTCPLPYPQRKAPVCDSPHATGAKGEKQGRDQGEGGEIRAAISRARAPVARERRPRTCRMTAGDCP